MKYKISHRTLSTWHAGFDLEVTSRLSLGFAQLFATVTYKDVE